MKRFLYLRILAITNLVVVVYCIASTIWMISTRRHLGGINFIIIGLVILTLCSGPGFFILFIYSRYYPDKEIPKAVIIAYRISDAIAWICTVFVFIAGVAMIVGKVNNYIAVLVCGLLAGSTITQLITGPRMLRTIRQNARLILENSFI